MSIHPFYSPVLRSRTLHTVATNNTSRHQYASAGSTPVLPHNRWPIPLCMLPRWLNLVRHPPPSPPTTDVSVPRAPLSLLGTLRASQHCPQDLPPERPSPSFCHPSGQSVRVSRGSEAPLRRCPFSQPTSRSKFRPLPHLLAAGGAASSSHVNARGPGLAPLFER